MEKLIKTTHETIVCSRTVYFASPFSSMEKIDRTGDRAHISIESEVEYKDTGIPIHLYENHFEFILTDLGAKIVYNNDDDDEEPLQNLDEGRVSVGDFTKAIRNLERLIKKENRTKRLCSKDYTISCLGLDADEFLCIMREIIANADTRDGYIHFRYYAIRG